MNRHELAVEKSGDEMINRFAVREDGVEYYAIGQRITVTWRGKDRYLCHTCVKCECVHIDRIKRYRAERPQ